MIYLIFLLLSCSLFLQELPCESVAQPAASDQDEQQDESMVKSILNSIQTLQKEIWQGAALQSPGAHQQLVEKVDTLQREVSTLSSELSGLRKFFSDFASSILASMTVLAQGTDRNRKSLDDLTSQFVELNKTLERRPNKNVKAPTSYAPLGANVTPITQAPSAKTTTENENEKMEEKKEEEREREVKEEQRHKLVLYGLARCSEANKVALSAIAGLSSSVKALERYASPTTGALINASKQIGESFGTVRARLQQLSHGQTELIKETARKLHGLEKAVKEMTLKERRKQDQLVVETATALLPYKYLRKTIRVDYTKKFTQAPQVYAAISGFAMDPDHESVKAEPNTSKAQDSLHYQIFNVQANFYAARIEHVSDIDSIGFSVRVDDGREYSYSPFQWIQIEWIAIGT